MQLTWRKTTLGYIGVDDQSNDLWFAYRGYFDGKDCVTLTKQERDSYLDYGTYVTMGEAKKHAESIVKSGHWGNRGWDPARLRQYAREKGL
jgi:hypothetical protein